MTMTATWIATIYRTIHPEAKNLATSQYGRAATATRRAARITASPDGALCKITKAKLMPSSTRIAPRMKKASNAQAIAPTTLAMRSSLGTQTGCTLTAVTVYSGQLVTLSLRPDVSSLPAAFGSERSGPQCPFDLIDVPTAVGRKACGAFADADVPSVVIAPARSATSCNLSIAEVATDIFDFSSGRGT